MSKSKIILSVAVVILLTACDTKQSNKERLTEDKSISSEKRNNPDAVIILAQSEPDTLKGSLTAQAIGRIGDAEIKISYHSPSVRGRIVWGGLVPFDKVWVTGAHMATSLEFSNDVMIGNKTVPAGKYALFTIPGKVEWFVIINKNWQQHLVDEYDPNEDIVRVKVKPEIEQVNQERLRYVIEGDTEKEGEIVLYWERLEVSIPFRIVYSH